MATLKSRLHALLHEVGDAGGGTMLEDAKRVAEAVGLEFRNVKTLVEEAEQNLFGESRDAAPSAAAPGSPRPEPVPRHSFPPLPPRTRAYPSEAPPPAEDEGSPAEDEALPPEDEGAPSEDEGAPAEDEGALEEDEEWPPPDDGATDGLDAEGDQLARDVGGRAVPSRGPSHPRKRPLEEWLPPGDWAADAPDAEGGQPARDAGGRAVPSRGPSHPRKRPLEADPLGGKRQRRRTRDKAKDKSKDKGKGKGKTYEDPRPGDWKCESCGYHNFAKNEACKQCGKLNDIGRDYPSNKSCKRFCIRWMTGACKNAIRCTFAHAPHELQSARDLREGSWLCEKCGRVLERRERGCEKCKFTPTRSTLVYDERKGDFSR